jgi:hypothetical protein
VGGKETLMDRRGKPKKGKAEAKRPLADESPKGDSAKVRDLEKRLAEALGQLQTRDRELVEALEQQTATADVLRIISTSTTELQPVLETVVRSAVRFCAAYDATIYELDGGNLTIAAPHGPIPTSLDPAPPDRGTVVGRAVLEARPVQVADLQVAADDFPSAYARQLGPRTVVSVPLLREGVAWGRSPCGGPT